MIADFDLVSSLGGGLLIGLAAVLLMALIGRIAGICGIASGILNNASGDRLWRFTFLGGLIIAPLLFGAFVGEPVPLVISQSTPALLIGGLLVGFGTIVGGGCTSGHGVCGLGRLSVRSLVSVVVFMATAFIVYNLSHHAFGWQL
ncbi:MAG: YeeE/YedE family protein [Rhodospirillales bacterium]|nr:YeeE/YedE family protein [Rhodospirillales bacterium]